MGFAMVHNDGTKKNKKSLVKRLVRKYYKEELKEQINKYRNAILADCEYFYVADITADVVIKAPDFKDDKTGMKDLNLQFPMGFNTYIQAWKSTLQPIYKETHAFRAQTREELLGAFTAGERNIQMDYKLKDKDIYFRKTTLLYERGRDGHLMATVVIHDITNERADEESHRLLLEALQNVYSSIFEGNLVDNFAQKFKSSGATGNHVPNAGRWDDLIEIWAGKTLTEDVYNKNKDFWDRTSLIARLRTTNILTRDIQTITGWIQVSIIVTTRDSMGQAVKVLWLTRSIDEQKRAEILATERLKEATKNADHDELTGLYNRHGFNKRLGRIVTDPRRHICSVIMMDIDDFKSVNDTYGHDAGDEVMKRIARTLKNIIRKDDLYCRWGGEEFNAFIYSGGDAEVIAERIRKAVEDMAVVYEGKVIRVTLSIGVCMVSDMKKITMNEIINTADRCLYISKRSGKNTVTVERI